MHAVGEFDILELGTCMQWVSLTVSNLVHAGSGGVQDLDRWDSISLGSHGLATDILGYPRTSRDRWDSISLGPCQSRDISGYPGTDPGTYGPPASQRRDVGGM